MGRLIVSNAMSVNGAFEAPEPEPAGWLVLDPESTGASLDMWKAADAMVMGRKTYDGLSRVWPEMADVPGMEEFAGQMNSVPKYVASTELGPLRLDLVDAATFGAGVVRLRYGLGRELPS